MKEGYTKAHTLSHSFTLSRAKFSIKPNSCNFERFTVPKIPNSFQRFPQGIYCFNALLLGKKKKYLNSVSLILEGKCLASQLYASSELKAHQASPNFLKDKATKPSKLFHIHIMIVRAK